MQYSYYFVPVGLFLYLGLQTSYAATPDTLREQAVLYIKNGQTQKGIIALEQLLQKYPQDQKVLADYLLSVNTVHPLDAATLLKLTQRIQVSQFPEYAQLSVVKLLRDQKLFNQALLLLQQFEPFQQKNQLHVNILKAILLSENQQKKQALAVLQKMSLKQLSAEQLMQVSYSYRILGQTAEALHAVQYAYEKQPKDKNIQQEYVDTLMALGSYQQAIEVIEKYPKTDWDPNLNQQIILGNFAQQIESAIKRSQYLSRRGESDTKSYEMLDAVLLDAEHLANEYTFTAPFFNRFYYDYIYALSVRGKSKTVLDLLQRVPLPAVTTMPAYVRQAIADAYLAERQAAQAEQLYRTLMTEKTIRI